MDQRVSTISGSNPVLLIAPHGYDDPKTDDLTEKLAYELDCCAVINHGWERDDKVDYLNDKADCNDVYHIHEPVVKDEFLEPILKFNKVILRSWSCSFIFVIHGVGNYIRNKVSDPDLDVIIGYGKGKPNKFSCEPWIKNAFAYHLEQLGVRTYVGKSGGRFAGRAKKNLNQLFVRHNPITNTHSMQLEVIRELRDNNKAIIHTSHMLSHAIENLMQSSKADNYGINMKIPEC